MVKGKKAEWKEYGDVLVRRKTFNNKTRQGKYILVKRGDRIGIYKEKSGVPLGSYHRAFYSGIRAKKLGVTRSTSAKTYLRKVKKTPPISSLLKKGISKTTINNILNMDNASKELAYRTLMKDLIKYSDMLDLIVKDENIGKLKTRLEHKIIITSHDGNNMATMKTFNRDLQQVRNDIEKNIVNGFFTKGTTFRLTAGNKYIIENVDFDRLYGIQNAFSIKDELTFVKGR